VCGSTFPTTDYQPSPEGLFIAGPKPRCREERIDTIIVGGDRSDLPQRKRADENKGVTDDDLYPSTPTNTAKKNTYEPPNLRRETEFTSSSIASTAGSKIDLGTETPKTNN
jgi:hypothetical protein